MKAVPRCNAVDDALLEEHLPLVKWVVAGMCCDRRYLPVLMHGGTVGLWEAAARYRPELGKFSTYARPYIYGYAMRELRVLRAAHRRECELQDDLYGEPAAGSRVEATEQVAHLLQRLTPRQREIVERMHLCGEPAPEVAQALGISVARVYQVNAEAMITMRRDEPPRLSCAQRLPASPRRLYGGSRRVPGRGVGLLSYEQVAALHAPGATTETIAKACGVTQPTLSVWRQANGFLRHWVLLTVGPRRPLGRLSFDEAMALHTPGVETATIAAAAGLHISNVCRWRSLVGLTPTWVQMTPVLAESA